MPAFVPPGIVDDVMRLLGRVPGVSSRVKCCFRGCELHVLVCVYSVLEV